LVLDQRAVHLAVGAQEGGVAVDDLELVGRQRHGGAVGALGVTRLLQAVVQLAQREVRIGALRILLHGALEALLGQGELALVHVGHAELRVGLRGGDRIDGPAAGAGADAAGQGQRRQPCAGDPRRPHGRTSGAVPAAGCCCTTTGTAPRRLPSRVRVRSVTRPASWPQAASMSSPRVLLIVAMTPPFNTWSRKALMVSGLERRYAVPGNGLKGMRLTLAGWPRSSFASARACAGVSFTPSSMTYSKVTLRPLASSTYFQQASSSSAMLCLRLIGTSWLRSSSSGACSDTASATLTS